MSLTPHEEENYLTEDTLLVFEYLGWTCILISYLFPFQALSIFFFMPELCA